jgi:hypothetical protein
MDRYRVHAPPERVVDAMARSTVPGRLLGYSLTDATAATFVGKITNDGTFDLRRPRGLATTPRVVVLRGKVHLAEDGAVVAVRYGLHPAVLLTRSVLLGFLILTAVIVIPASFGDLRLLWILVVFAFVVALMLAPYEWLARADRTRLRSDFEETLGRAGSIVREDP